MAGVIGNDSPQYDIIGPTVNLASRMMSTGKMDKIQVPENVYEILSKNNFNLDERPNLVKVKGYEKPLRTYFLNQYMPKESTKFSYRMLQNLVGFGGWRFWFYRLKF